MLDFKKLFALAKEKGIEDIQISYASETSKEISYTDKELDSFSINTNSYLSAKGIYNHKMGSYSTELIDESEFETIVNKIIESAKYITNEDEVFIYEGDERYETLKNEFNEELSKIDINEKMKVAESLTLKTLKLPYVVHSESGYGETEVYSVMANSKGLHLESHSNGYEIYVAAVVSKDGGTRNKWSFRSYNDFNKINVDILVKEAYDEAYKSIGAGPIESGEYETVFSEGATSTLLSVFSGMFSSEANQKKLSILKDREGSKIASDCVTLVDNPLLEESMSSQTYDSDGVATRYQEIIKDGVFTGFVYNLKTAKKENKKSTGNAIGASCGLLLPYFKPGNRTKDEIIASIKKGIYITGLQGAHAGANEISGDFSLQSMGFLIEDGKLTKPVALVTSASNFLEVLSNITEVSSEIRNAYDQTAIRVSKISISGN